MAYSVFCVCESCAETTDPIVFGAISCELKEHVELQLTVL